MEQVLTHHLKDGSEYTGGTALPALVMEKKALLAMHAKMRYPNNSLDELIDQLGGPDVVAEMVRKNPSLFLLHLFDIIARPEHVFLVLYIHCRRQEARALCVGRPTAH